MLVEIQTCICPKKIKLDKNYNEPSRAYLSKIYICQKEYVVEMSIFYI